MFLTSTDLGDHSLCQGSALCQLLSKALTHVVIDIIGSQQLLEGLRVVEKCKSIDHKMCPDPFSVGNM